MLAILITTTAVASNVAYYQVGSGDTLWFISQQYGVKLEELIAWNDVIDPQQIQVGQVLKIYLQDKQEGEWIVYRVEPGDTLWKLSREYGVGLNQLLEFNRVNNENNLLPGRYLVIPPKKLVNPNNKETFYLLHKVLQGQSLWTISQQYNITVNEIFQANGQWSDDLHPGDELLIPLIPESSSFWLFALTNQEYRVQQGETLEEISHRYKIPENILRRLNGIGEEVYLRSGRIILMPVNPMVREDYGLYRVAEGGEYIFDIACKFERAVKPILQANYLPEPNEKIEEGTYLIVPMTCGTEGNWVNLEDEKY